MGVRRASGFLLTALSNTRRTAVFLFSLWRRRASDKALALLGSNPQLSDWSNRTTLWRDHRAPGGPRKKAPFIIAVGGAVVVIIVAVKNYPGPRKKPNEYKGAFWMKKT